MLAERKKGRKKNGERKKRMKGRKEKEQKERVTPGTAYSVFSQNKQKIDIFPLAPNISSTTKCNHS